MQRIGSAILFDTDTEIVEQTTVKSLKISGDLYYKSDKFGAKEKIIYCYVIYKDNAKIEENMIGYITTKNHPLQAGKLYELTVCAKSTLQKLYTLTELHMFL